MGVDVHEAAPGARPDRSVRRRQFVRAFGLLVTVNLALCALGIWTGNGPLGPPGGYGVGTTRPVGSEVTDGNTSLVNHGWLPVHVDSIKPVAAQGAADGLTTTAVELTPTADPRIGLDDGPGYGLVPAAERTDASGQVLPSNRGDKPPGLGVPVLVRVKVTKPGSWHYDGYEVVYRAGFVRHRMTVPVQFWICTDVTIDNCPPRSD